MVDVISTNSTKSCAAIPRCRSCHFARYGELGEIIATGPQQDRICHEHNSIPKGSVVLAVTVADKLTTASTINSAKPKRLLWSSTPKVSIQGYPKKKSLNTKVLFN
jgi:ADP-ribosylglycohydrolase